MEQNLLNLPVTAGQHPGEGGGGMLGLYDKTLAIGPEVSLRITTHAAWNGQNKILEAACTVTINVMARILIRGEQGPGRQTVLRGM